VKKVILSLLFLLLSLTARATPEDFMYWFGPWECGAPIALGGAMGTDIHLLPFRGETRFRLDGKAYRMDGLREKMGTYRMLSQPGAFNDLEVQRDAVPYEQLSVHEIFVMTRVIRMREIRRRMLNLMNPEFPHAVTLWERAENYELARNIFYAAPVFPDPNFELARQRIRALRLPLRKTAPVGYFLEDLEKYQPTIQWVRAYWDSMVVQREMSQGVLTESAAYFGIFRDVVEAAHRHDVAASDEIVQHVREWARRFEAHSPGLEARVVRWVHYAVSPSH
jgi:hypothetical protein